MRVYTKDEAELMNWRAELVKLKENKETNRIKILNDLLAIIDNVKETDKPLEKITDAKARLKKFNEYKASLLDKSYNPDWRWQKHFRGLFSFLQYILPNWLLKKQPGSRLRQVLEEFDPIPKDNFLTKEQIRPQAELVHPLNAKEFENALFYQPRTALIYLRDNIFYLKAPVKEEQIKYLLNCLAAIKRRLDPLLYFDLTLRIYKLAPNQAIEFFYKNYLNEQYDADSQLHDYVELHCLARSILEKFILPHGNQIQLHNSHELLTLLSLARVPGYEEIINDARQRCHPPEEPLTITEVPLLDIIKNKRTLSSVYRYLQKSVIHFIHTHQEASEREAAKVKKRLSSSNQDEDARREGPLTILQKMYQIQFFERHDDPLMLHFSWLLCEQLFANYFKAVSDKSESNLGSEQLKYYEKTIEFIGETFFNVKSAFNYNEKEVTKFFNTFNQSATFIPNEFKHGEDIALQFNLAARRGKDYLLEFIRQFNSKNKLIDQLTKNWILSRLEHILNDEDTFKAAKHVLLHPIVFSWPDFCGRFHLAVGANNWSPTELQHLIKRGLRSSKEANKSFKETKEREAINEMLTYIYLYVRHEDLKSPDFQWLISTILPELAHYHYLDENCRKELIHFIIQHHASSVKKTYSPDFVPVEEVEDLYSKINYCNEAIKKISDSYAPDLPNLYQLAHQAIYYFDLYLNTYQKENTKVSVYPLEKIISDLRDYIPDEKYQAWCKKLGLNLPANNALGFFNARSGCNLIYNPSLLDSEEIQNAVLS